MIYNGNLLSDEEAREMLKNPDFYKDKYYKSIYEVYKSANTLELKKILIENFLRHPKTVYELVEFLNNFYKSLEPEIKDCIEEFFVEITNDIANASSETKYLIKWRFLDRDMGIKQDDESIRIYNLLSVDDFKKLLELAFFRPKNFTYKLFSSIENKEKLLFKNLSIIFNSEVSTNEEILKFYLTNDTILAQISSYTAKEILSSIRSEEIKKIFSNRLIEICSSKDDLLSFRNCDVIKYVSKDIVISAVKRLFSDFVDTLKTTDEYDEETKKMIKSILGYIYMNEDIISVQIFNLIPTDTFKKILKLVEITTIKMGTVNEINDYEKLVLPYHLGCEDALVNPKYAETVITNPIFYETEINYFRIETIVNTLTTDELRYKFIDCLYKHTKEQFKNEIINCLMSKRPIFYTYIKDDIIIDFLKEGVSTRNLLKFFSILSDKGKIDVYKSDWFNEKYDVKTLLRELSEVLPDEIIYEIYEDLFDPIIMYSRTKRLVYLKIFIEHCNEKKLANKNDIFLLKSLLSIPDSQLEQLGETKEKLFLLIDSIPDENLIELFFEYYPSDNPTIIKDYIYKRVKEKLESNNLIIEHLCIAVLKTRNKELLELMFNHSSKADLLLLSVKHPYFNEKLLSILKENPNYLSSCIIENLDKYGNIKVDEDNIDFYMRIYQYLNYNQQKVFYEFEFIKEDEELRNRYIEDVRKNSDSLLSLEHLQLFEEKDIKNILSNISIERFMYLVYFKVLTLESRKLIVPYMKSRVDDVAFFLNDSSLAKTIWDSKKPCYIIFTLFENEDTINLINKIDNLDFLAFSDSQLPKQFRDIVQDRIANILNLIIEIPTFSNFPSFTSKDKGFNFFNKLSFESFMGLFVRSIKYEPRGSEIYNVLVDYLYENLNENFDLIYNISITENLVELLRKIPNDLSNRMIKEIESNYEILKDKYPKLQKYINTISDKANYVGAIKNNLINENNIELVYNMAEENKYLFNSMDFRLLQPDLLKFGNYFISKLSRYPSSAIKISKIYEQNKSKCELLLLLSNKLRKEKNDSIYDHKIEMMINYLLMHDIELPEKIDDNLIHNIENYILDYYYIRDSKFINLSINNYIDERNKLIDKQIEECENYDNLVNLIYLKHFSINKNMIDIFLFQYAENWNSVAYLCSSELPNKYIELILNINSISDINVLKETSKRLDSFTISDYLTVTGIMISTYNKSIKNDLYLKRPGIMKEIEIDGKKIEVEDITKAFGIILHSTDAYGSMPLINDNYYDSWNNNSNTRNHGICCSYISNSSYGTAAVKDNGVMFGFEINDENAVPIYAPYDLGTRNTGFTLTSNFKPYYCRLQSISDITRHTHNELDLERRINGIVGSSQLRQPQYIIIFEDMSEQVKKNSIKAYEDFKAKGIDIKIKYIDRVKNCHIEADILKQMIEEFKTTYDMHLLHLIINKYESNICSCDFLGTGKSESLGLFNQHELFNTIEVRQIINDAIEYIKNVQNIEQRNILITQFIQIINIEKRKFDLIEDFNKDRKHTFDLYDERLKNDIILLTDLLNQTVLEEKKYN